MAGRGFHTYATVIGTIGISDDGNGTIARVYLSDPPAGECVETPVIKEASKQINEFLSGKRKNFDLPLVPPSTEFGTKVRKALTEIPYGCTETYARIAEKAGSPNACRAVGNACRNNPLPLIIPCHRVIPASGGIGKFAGGTAMKEKLLDLERDG